MKYLIVVMGVDGVGKTTIVSLLKKYLDLKGVTSKIEYMGIWHNQIIPIFKIYKILESFLSRFRKNKEENRQALIFTKSSTSKFFGEKKKSFRILKEVILYIELTIRYIIRIFLSSKKVILCDRYIYDLLVYPHSLLLSELIKFYPKPSLVILLTGPEDIIFSRRKQHSSLWIKKTQETYREIFNQYNLNWIEINATLTPSNIIEILDVEIEKVLGNSIFRGEKFSS